MSLGRFKHALAAVQGLPISDTVTYSFEVTLPSDARLRFRPLLHPAAEACWADGPHLRVTLRQRGTDYELWSGNLENQFQVRVRLWWQALITRTFPNLAPRSLLPPEEVLPLTVRGRATLRFEASGERQECELDGWYAENGGHRISPEAVWGMPMLQAPEFSDRPDIVLIVLDTLRADALKLYGGPQNTPHLQRLARDGVVFERAFTTFPMTREATFSLITGRHPSELGVPFWRWALRPEERTIAAARAAESLPAQARRNGLRSVFAGNNGFLIESAPVGYDGNWGEVRFFYKEPADAVHTAAVFREWARDPQRMFAYLHFNQPHWPHVTDPEYPTDATGGFTAEYLSEIRSADASLGSIMAALRKNERYDNSLIIVTADHGELFPDGEKAGHGTTLNMAELRIPLVIRFPHGQFGGRVIGDAVSLADIAPTLREALGWSERPSAGRSLMPLVRGDYANLPSRLVGWEGKGIDGYTDGIRFYTAHHAGYRPMAGVIPGPVETAWIWPQSTNVTVPVAPTNEDRVRLAQLEDTWTRNREQAWREIARAAGDPPLPPRPVYAFAGLPESSISTEPDGALRYVTADTTTRRYKLVPPSATVRIRAAAPVLLGAWLLPFGGAMPEIRTDTERRLLLGQPKAVTGPTAWIDEAQADDSKLGEEVKDALRGWGYVK